MKLAVLACLVLLGGTAAADRGQPRPDRDRPMRRLLLEKFDRNQDGRLQPRERKQAARALRRIAKQLQHGRVARRQRFIQRFDRNGDGNIGPDEMPPSLADELRPLDRDGNGWLQGNELP